MDKVLAHLIVSVLIFMGMVVVFVVPSILVSFVRWELFILYPTWTFVRTLILITLLIPFMLNEDDFHKKVLTYFKLNP